MDLLADVAIKAKPYVKLPIREKGISKFQSRMEADVFMLLHRRFNINDDDDGKVYAVETLGTFYIRKKKMVLVHFVGYSTFFDRLIPVTKLRNI
jgi:hypothetical protein